MKNFHRTLVIGCSTLALTACGPQDLGSPGANGDINIGDINNTVNSNNTTNNPPAPTPSPTGGGVSTPAANCPSIADPQGLTDTGTISGTSGEWRVCQLPGTLMVSSTLPQVKGVIYSMNGRVDVGVDDGPTADNSDGVTGTKATLTIEPGVAVYGVEGPSGGSYIVVNRGSKMMANGTAQKPIIFTAEVDVRGQAQPDTSARWGGVVLLGRANVADCFAGGINDATAPDPNFDYTKCEMKVEGIADNIPFFGGDTNDDSSGSLKYVQIRYSGFTLELGSELQSLTLGGIGSGTSLDYIQSYNSSDDGQEFFGGFVNEKHYVAVGAEDDSIDTDSGVQANIQYAVVVQRDGVGDHGIENDSPANDHGPGTTIPDALPRTLTQISNLSLWGASNGDLIDARGGGDLTVADSVLYKPTATGKPCAHDHGETNGGVSAQLKFFSVELDCTTNTFTDAGVANGSNSQFLTNTLLTDYINGTTETSFTPIYDPTALSAFFATTTFIGSVVSTGTPWTQGWTCDSATVSFGSGLSCDALPVYS